MKTRGLTHCLIGLALLLAAALPAGSVAAADGTLAGVVMGKPACGNTAVTLVNAEVFIMQPDGVSYYAMTTTNSQGAYAMRYAPGTFEVVVRAEGFSDKRYPAVTIPDGGPVSLDAVLDANEPCMTFPGGAISIDVPVDQFRSSTLSVQNAGAVGAPMEWVELNPPQQVLGDPSAEDESVSSPWTDVSGPSFVQGSQVCNPIRYGARTGSCLFMMAGPSTQETGYVSQTVTIPPGVADLSFWYREIDCRGSAEYVLSIDGTPLWKTDSASMTCNNATPVTYLQKIVNIDAFADGAQHTLRFDFKATDSAMVLDDIEIRSYASYDAYWLDVMPATASLRLGGSVNSLVRLSGLGTLPNVTSTAYLTVKPRGVKTPIIPVTLRMMALTMLQQGVYGFVNKPDSCTGEMIGHSGAWVEISDASGLRAAGATLSDGSFMLPLQAGNYQVKVSDLPDGTSQTLPAEVRPGLVTPLNLIVANTSPCLAATPSAITRHLTPASSGKAVLTVTNAAPVFAGFKLREVKPAVQLVLNPSAEVDADWGISTSSSRSVRSCVPGTAHTGSCSFLMGSGQLAENVYLLQNMAIPQTFTQLHFWYRLRNCANYSDNLRVSLGMQELWRTDGKDTGCDQGYQEAWVDLTGLTFGGGFDLKIEYHGVAMIAELDDISLDSYEATLSPWLTLPDGMQILEKGEVRYVDIGFSSTGLADGTYNTLMVLDTYGAKSPVMPVTLVVGNASLYLPAVMK